MTLKIFKFLKKCIDETILGAANTDWFIKSQLKFARYLVTMGIDKVFSLLH